MSKGYVRKRTPRNLRNLKPSEPLKQLNWASVLIPTIFLVGLIIAFVWLVKG